MAKLNKEQEARIYCVKNGHANYVTFCFGYVHCGRCGDQIGDRLGGCFDMKNTIAVSCKGKCKTCTPLIKKLSPLDKKIFDRLKRGMTDYKKILKDINFN